MPEEPREQSVAGGSDAVGFTAGIEGAPFGVGVVHAYLAADREPPVLVAGISMGAVNAAAMQRVYVEMHGSAGPAKEARRWRWFRKYLHEIARNPLSVFWDSIPDQSDFFTDRPPIHDPATPGPLRSMESDARRQRFLLTKLGNWLSDCHVKVKDVASLIVNYIRFTERHPGWVKFGFTSALQAWQILSKLTWQVVRHPSMIRERDFTWDKSVAEQAFEISAQKSFPRPLFGWFVWSIAFVIEMFPVAGLLILVVLLIAVLNANFELALFAGALFAAGGFVYVFLMALFTGLAGRFWRSIRTIGRSVKKLFGGRIRPDEPGSSFLIRRTLANLGIDRSLLHPFAVRRAIHELFGNEKLAKREGAPHLLIVAAPLQVLFKVKNLPPLPPWRTRFRRKLRGGRDNVTSAWAALRSDPRRQLAKLFTPDAWITLLKRLRQRVDPVEAPEPVRPEIAAQLWARAECPIDEALQAAVSAPPFLPPLHIPKNKCRLWLSEKKPGDSRDDMIIAETELDLIDGSVIRQNPLPAMFTFLRHDGGDVRGRLATGTEEKPSIHVVYTVPAEDRSTPRKLTEQDMNIVDVALLSRRLASRRDTGLEVEQTNFITRLEEVIGSPHPKRVKGFAGEIAPAEDIGYDNPLKPTTKEILETVAAGCRRTLEKLYFKEPADPDGTVECGVFLRSKWRDRPQDAQLGLPEVCGVCPGRLNLRREKNKATKIEVRVDSVLSRPDVAARPRVVFVTSGGVFRGSFHIGMLAALDACNLRPDLIVGASIGTLMGAAFAKMAHSKEVLRELVELFASVDRRIALTRTFKSAVRQLGVRGESIDLSPADLKAAVRRGSRGDAGFAATGAPPALIDALSTLFLLPHENTREIAARFVAGHVSDAAGKFLGALRAETLRRLGVEKYLIGSSLLEPEIRKLLKMGGDSFDLQPFAELDFYATATNLATEGLVVLGSATQEAGQSYDFVKAALASSAFPVVFSPVRESDVYPGIGRPDVYYGDGGMFDNLPFLPAIKLLSASQQQQKWADKIAQLQRRHDEPDLMVVGALNVNPEERVTRETRFTTLAAASRRASELQENVKIRGFQKSAERIDEQIGRLLRREGLAELRNFDLDAIVNAAVLPVFPSSQAHLNRTFAFSATTGLSSDVIYRSIGDGCFRTLQAVADQQYGSDSSDRLTKKALDGIVDSRLRRVVYATGDHPTHHCPFFKGLGGAAIECPFVFRSGKKVVADVYQNCRHDGMHVAMHDQGKRRPAAPPSASASR